MIAFMFACIVVVVFIYLLPSILVLLFICFMLAIELLWFIERIVTWPFRRLFK